MAWLADARLSGTPWMPDFAQGSSAPVTESDADPAWGAQARPRGALPVAGALFRAARTAKAEQHLRVIVRQGSLVKTTPVSLHPRPPSALSFQPGYAAVCARRNIRIWFDGTGKGGATVA